MIISWSYHVGILFLNEYYDGYSQILALVPILDTREAAPTRW